MKAPAKKAAAPAKKAAAPKPIAKKAAAVPAKKAAPAVTKSSPPRKAAPAAKKAAPAKKAVTVSSPPRKAAPAAKKASSKKSGPAERVFSGAKKTSGPVPEAEEWALFIAKCADEMKAEDIIVLDVSKLSTITDYFVICTGSSLPHLKAVTREVREGMREKFDRRAASADGAAESQWLVLDYGTAMVHVFHQSKRDLYALEDLWSDARRVPFTPVAAPAQLMLGQAKGRK